MEYFVEPWDHQREAFIDGENKRNLFLAWEMGTGKTATTINLIRQRFANVGNQKVLILAPKVVLYNWLKEFGEHSNIDQRYITVLTGSSNKKVDTFLRMTADPLAYIFITNYESLDNDSVRDILVKWKPDILVCDESHRLKSHRSKRSKTVFKIAKSTTHNYLLTGTPILNSPADIFMQFKILEANKINSTFGIKYSDFLYEWFEDKNARMRNRLNYFPKWALKSDRYRFFHSVVAKRISRVTKEECLDLPPLVKKKFEIELHPEQKRAYKEMKNEFITFLKEQAPLLQGGSQAVDRVSVATLAITKALRLQQIVSGYIKLDTGEDYIFKKNPRLDVLSELVSEIHGQSKIIIWANFRRNITQIEELLDQMGVKYETLYGGTKDKQGAIDRFVGDETVRVFVANQKAAGTGVNGLQLAPYAIYYSRSYSLEDDHQSESRNHRGGSEQHDSVTRIDLVTRNTIDELILEALASKQNVADLILDWAHKL